MSKTGRAPSSRRRYRATWGVFAALSWCSNSEAFLAFAPSLPSSGGMARRRHPSPLHAATLPQADEKKQLQVRGGASASVTPVPSDVASAPASAAAAAVTQGRLLLGSTALLYGTYNIALKLLYGMEGSPAPSMLSFVRAGFSVAYFAYAFYQQQQQQQQQEQQQQQRRQEKASSSAEGAVSASDEELQQGTSRAMLVMAAELALWNFGAVACLNAGLLYTSAARAAFLAQTSVVITPLLCLARRAPISKYALVGAAFVMSGLALLSAPPDAVLSLPQGFMEPGGSGGVVGGVITSCMTALSGLSKGDTILLGGALSWTCYITRLDMFAGRPGAEHTELLQGWKNLFIFGLYGLWLGSDVLQYLLSGAITASSDVMGLLWSGWSNPLAWALIIFSGVVPGAIADVLQARGQLKVSSPAEANVILSLEPLFTALFAAVLLHEYLPLSGCYGAALVFMGAVVSCL